MPKRVTLDKSVALVDEETGEVLATESLPTTPAAAEAALANAVSETMPVFFKTNYNHNTLDEAIRTSTGDFEQTKTQQHLQDEVDINHILAKFGIANVAQRPFGTFMDVPEDLDLASAFDQFARARDAFEALPQNIQQHFETIENYVEYIEQAAAQGNIQALAKLGILKDPPPAPTPPAAPTAAPAAPTTAPAASPPPAPGNGAPGAPPA